MNAPFLHSTLVRRFLLSAAAGLVALTSGCALLDAATQGTANQQRLEYEIWKDKQQNQQIQQRSGNSAAEHEVTDHQMSDGSVYTGRVKNVGGQLWMHGWGRITRPDGRDILGSFKDNKPSHVGGVEIYPDGTKQVGELVIAGNKGRGIIRWKDGREYNGEWRVVTGEVDHPDGKWTMTWPDRRKYEGEWKDGKMHGFGKLTMADGKVQEGVWRGDKFVSAQTAPSVSPAPSGGKQGSVSVSSSEEEAEVLVDGSFVGNAPAKLKLSEGTHVIEVKKDGFKPFKKEIKVTEGSELNLRAVLQKQ